MGDFITCEPKMCGPKRAQKRGIAVAGGEPEPDA
jgi:hypothetical protein